MKISRGLSSDRKRWVNVCSILIKLQSARYSVRSGSRSEIGWVRSEEAVEEVPGIVRLWRTDWAGRLVRLWQRLCTGSSLLLSPRIQPENQRRRIPPEKEILAPSQQTWKLGPLARLLVHPPSGGKRGEADREKKLSLRETGADRGRGAGGPDQQRRREGKEVGHRTDTEMERRRIRMMVDQTKIREEKTND